eukprot:403334331
MKEQSPKKINSIEKSRNSSIGDHLLDFKLSDQQKTIISILKKSPETRTDKDLQILIPIVQNISFFKEKKIKARDLIEICQRLKYENISAQKNVIQYGEYGDRFYIILEGQVSVWIPDKDKNKSSMAGSQAFQSVTSNINHNLRNIINSNISKEKMFQAKKLLIKNLQADMFVQEGNAQDDQIQQQTIDNKTQKTSIDINATITSQEVYESKQLQSERQYQSNMASVLYSKQISTKNMSNYREVAKLSEGKTFGELALIVHKPRMATIKCEVNTHFAVLDKYDFQKCLGKLEKKQMNKMIDFLKNIQCFKSWTRNSVGKFSYFLTKQKFKRGQIVYRENQLADKVFIVKKGEFELQRKLGRTLNEVATEVVELMGKKVNKPNFLAKKLPEIKDVPNQMRITLFGSGSLLGEEDTLKGTLFILKKNEFMLLRSQDESWLTIIEKIIEKEKRRRGDWLSEDNAEYYNKKISQKSIYQITNDKTDTQNRFNFYKQNLRRDIEIPTSALINQGQNNDKNIKLSSLLYLNKNSPEKVMNIQKLLQMSQDTRNRLPQQSYRSSQMQKIANQDLLNHLKDQPPNLNENQLKKQVNHIANSSQQVLKLPIQPEVHEIQNQTLYYKSRFKSMDLNAFMPPNPSQIYKRQRSKDNDAFLMNQNRWKVKIRLKVYKWEEEGFTKLAIKAWFNQG